MGLGLGSSKNQKPSGSETSRPAEVVSHHPLKMAASPTPRDQGSATADAVAETADNPRLFVQLCLHNFSNVGQGSPPPRAVGSADFHRKKERASSLIMEGRHLAISHPWRPRESFFQSAFCTPVQENRIPFMQFNPIHRCPKATL